MSAQGISSFKNLVAVTKLVENHPCFESVGHKVIWFVPEPDCSNALVGEITDLITANNLICDMQKCRYQRGVNTKQGVRDVVGIVLP